MELRNVMLCLLPVASSFRSEFWLSFGLQGIVWCKERYHRWLTHYTIISALSKLHTEKNCLSKAKAIEGTTCPNSQK